MADPIQVLRDCIAEAKFHGGQDEFTEAADDALAQVEALVEAADDADRQVGHRRGYENEHPSLTRLRDALAPFKENA